MILKNIYYFLFFIFLLNTNLFAGATQMLGYTKIESMDNNSKYTYEGGYLGYDFMTSSPISIGIGVDDIIFNIPNFNSYYPNSNVNNVGLLFKIGIDFRKNGIPLIVKGGAGVNNFLVDGDSYHGKQFESSFEVPLGNNFFIGAKYKKSDVLIKKQEIKMNNFIYFISFGNF